MNFVAAHYIISGDGTRHAKAILELASGTVSDYDSLATQQEPAFTIFYNGIICPNYWNATANEIAQTLLHCQTQHPLMTIEQIINLCAKSTPHTWIAIENINLQTMHIDHLPQITLLG